MLRYNRESTVFMNMLCDKIIKDFIDSCEPCKKKSGSGEKTFGWEQFNPIKFQNTFSYSLMISSKYFNDLLTIKRMLKEVAFEKEINRLLCGRNKSQCTSVEQDMKEYSRFLVEERKNGTASE